MTRVVNKFVERGTVYIGRKSNGMHFGNPFTHKKGTLGSIVVKDRREAVARFSTWLLGETDTDLEPQRRAWIMSNVSSLRGEALECFCKPAACHGDVLAEMADQ